MSMSYAQKLKSIRAAEGLTQKQLSELTGVSLGMIKNYESEQHPAGVQTVEKVIQVERFEKYTLWLMTGKTAPAAGQVSPPLSPDGQDKIKSRPSDQKTG
ncbi:XRE family transcriptional regulator [Escherichia coli]|uniref:helix-turn-helix transcriptional regulator n=1 Tax=Enterobacteriaceae TaxID=543 RepID=UPI0002A46C9F|nr:MULTISPECIES: helix-turn-helix transcriptional regulator [Enterobacteriaceae]HBM9353351.1 helix-turn-helix transcriptional regulator [Citrobacter freundii]EFD0291034.1 helix-turn-helix transcriptional regulator [Escherichia coli]EFN7993727.1 XRE family transcriptional regulator [Escherichia coli]EGM0668444.1 helix-turn-helix transcriptional regulator [Escherichia coli]EIT7544037.1 helix-turn-helix transcriptional regulator [Escherichia coli]